MRSLKSTLFVLAGLAAPWLVIACGLAPLTPPGTTSSTSSSSSGGGEGTTTSSTTTSSYSTTTTTTSSSSTSTTSSSTTTSSVGGSGGQAGTGGTTGTGGQTGMGGTGGAPDAGPPDSGPPVCNTTVAQYAIDPSPHVTACFPVIYSSNPPTSGPHYPIWAAFKTYTTPVPRGFWVHSLEHGAVVLAYNCPSGCDAELAQLATWLEARPADPLCFAPLKSRIIVTPDPELDVRFAAAAWGWSLKSSCFDLTELGPFIDAHYAQAPENFCFDGTDVTSPDAGIPPDCGHSFPDGG